MIPVFVYISKRSEVIRHFDRDKYRIESANIFAHAEQENLHLLVL